MEKDAILNIILNDIKEIELLVSTFKGKPLIPATYFKLVNSKLSNLNDEMLMLEELHKDNQPTEQPKAPMVKATENNKTETVKESEVKNEPLSFIMDEPEERKPQQKTTSSPAQQTVQAIEIKSTGQEPQPEINVTPPVVPSPVTSVAEPKQEMPQAPIVVPTTAAPIAQAKSKTDHSVLGETINKNHTSLNENISRHVTQEDLTNFGSPVSDIRKALGINDRFYFQRELFDNNNDMFNNALDIINTMNSYNQAHSYLINSFGWDESLKETEEFLRAVRRRFL